MGALRAVLLTLLLAVSLPLIGPLAPAWAVSANSFSPTPPAERVLDRADVFSRSAHTALSRQLTDLQRLGVEARLITLRRLDYGLALDSLGSDLLNRWHDGTAEQLLVLLQSPGGNAAIVADEPLLRRLPPGLLDDTADNTIEPRLHQGSRYRQASLEGLQRIAMVLSGGEDPGAPPIREAPVAQSNVPSREETASSNALLWVAVLLVAGSVVPMLTWWVFSR
ncbi:MAG: TPM domain-containing protein [Aphanocapsa feldmannii 277cV]|uniref:TPM domain-containing protein n=2 Tax=Aphanocapsa feldmannii TaxID=192050 RepID=A0A524RRY1_9CHRO|nr:MAG: TPM domain-containing protein [Aphanocapsa feldmannii 288cV]TGG96807.1 MAG: TPM domain-containing protein [Aphanocapsa feldmannii 277cV]TGH22269.1 MAG: TPM domain-containing protein [Aphanocapsa feldmannii 277cI]